MPLVRATWYNDPPPGAGNLASPGYHFAELGTATHSGGATGVGWLARAFGMSGELPMGFACILSYGSREVTATKQDRGYGQGGDGTHSDPLYALDLYDGSLHGLANVVAALGWHPNDWIGVRPAAPGTGMFGQTQVIQLGPAPPDHNHDYHGKVRETGRRASVHGSEAGRIHHGYSTSMHRAPHIRP